MTGCECHDPVVFGHGRKCRLRLGPDRTGGAIGHADWHVSAHAQEYDPTTPPDRVPNPLSWPRALAETAPKWAAAMRSKFDGR